MGTKRINQVIVLIGTVLIMALATSLYTPAIVFDSEEDKKVNANTGDIKTASFDICMNLNGDAVVTEVYNVHYDKKQFITFHKDLYSNIGEEITATIDSKEIPELDNGNEENIWDILNGEWKWYAVYDINRDTTEKQGDSNEVDNGEDIEHYIEWNTYADSNSTVRYSVQYTIKNMCKRLENSEDNIVTMKFMPLGENFNKTIDTLYIRVTTEYNSPVALSDISIDGCEFYNDGSELLITKENYNEGTLIFNVTTDGVWFDKDLDTATTDKSTTVMERLLPLLLIAAFIIIIILEILIIWSKRGKDKQIHQLQSISKNPLYTSAIRGSVIRKE